MTPSQSGDETLMDAALAAARRADFATSPNPMVGCVVVRGGTVIATGWHERAGARHAEIMALDAAGEKARGADLYVTLEPCTRQGRTPPCVDSLITAAPRRVVVAMLDPNPRESGRGVQRLRASGVETVVGVREAQARALNIFYGHHITTGRAYVTAKFAASLDGRVATATGEARWITGQEAREMAHRLRHEHDAVMVGAGTVVADDPRLTARFDGARQPLRVVVDSTLRVPDTAAVLRDDRERTLLATTGRAPTARIAELRERGVRVEVVAERDGRVDLAALLELLGGIPAISVLVEGGPTLLGGLFDARLVQRVVAMIAPRVIGGVTAPAAVAGRGVVHLAGASPLRDVAVERCGRDIVVSGYCDGGDM